ncbi:MAG: ribosome-associated translation inhibitor RaiA [Deltaproteobacteria bacterium]|nr:ribosome-associated translation inhibitor RaiA [Deltaproteobacteria bacterium]
MNVHVTFRHLASSQSLREHVIEKLDKFKKYLHDPIDVNVVLSVEKIRQIAEINLHAKDFQAHAIEESPDMYSSIDLVINKMEQQLRKHKDKIKDHKNPQKVFTAPEPAL